MVRCRVTIWPSGAIQERDFAIAIKDSQIVEPIHQLGSYENLVKHLPKIFDGGSSRIKVSSRRSRPIAEKPPHWVEKEAIWNPRHDSFLGFRNPFCHYTVKGLRSDHPVIKRIHIHVPDHESMIIIQTFFNRRNVILHRRGIKTDRLHILPKLTRHVYGGNQNFVGRHVDLPDCHPAVHGIVLRLEFFGGQPRENLDSVTLASRMPVFPYIHSAEQLDRILGLEPRFGKYEYVNVKMFRHTANAQPNRFGAII
jgi:hypothetical protein